MKRPVLTEPGNETSKDELKSPSTTFKISAGFIGALGLTFVGLMSSFSVGAATEPPQTVTCYTEANGDYYTAVLGVGVFEKQWCAGFFFLDVENNNTKNYFSSTCPDELTDNCNHEAASTPITWKNLSNSDCAREDTEGNFRLINLCVNKVAEDLPSSDPGSDPVFDPDPGS